MSSLLRACPLLTPVRHLEDSWTTSLYIPLFHWWNVLNRLLITVYAPNFLKSAYSSLSQHPKTMVYVHFLTSVYTLIVSTGPHSAHYCCTVAPALMQITNALLWRTQFTGFILSWLLYSSWARQQLLIFSFLLCSSTSNIPVYFLYLVLSFET